MKTGKSAYRWAVGLALAAALIMVWISLAVGIIRDEDNLANLMYVGVLAVGAIGAVIARLHPRGMARAMFATALAQTLVLVVALIFGMNDAWLSAFLGLHGFFILMFAGSAMLFHKAARKPASTA